MLLRATSLAVVVGALASAVTAASLWPVNDITLSILDKARSQTKELHLDYPTALSTPVLAQAGEVVKLSFKIGEHNGKKALPHQAMIRFQSKDEYADSIMVVGSVSKSSGRGRIEIDLASSTADERFKYNTRQYNMELLIGGYIQDLDSFKYDLGTIEIEAPASNPAIRPARVAYTAQPEIHHQFRPDQKLINVVVSGTFTALVLAPWLILALLWSRLNIRFEPLRALAQNPKDIFMALLFMVSLFSIETTLYSYWVGVTLFPTLQQLGVWSVVAAVSGRSALSALQKRRLQRTGGDSGAKKEL
ncbi:hypothetical protein DFQ27_008508 [Actinomortierella ambigua]|uniref:Ribophorin II n=1 Tax=Actinomortierella ambigua TaxID=1343610 RepID=A0A9P6TYQ8_9FUNG|nr:hypothetical protein DFQ27_008508 [Actinomortierella ambigua]